MSITLNRFAVMDLHGKVNVDIPIFDNKLILIGVNGLGKTTVVNIIYFTLTAQWERLLEYEFSAIELNINRSDIRIERSQIQFKLKTSVRFNKILNRWAARASIPPVLFENADSQTKCNAS